MAHREVTINAMIRGYQQIWEAEDGEALQCIGETGNWLDLYAIATVKNDVVVGVKYRLLPISYR